ncbi:MAG: glycosyltransferase [Deltaproteobacteria bacterium]|nr:glycosyltransferase [Deltaproteobacteria bacterium]
MRVLMIHPHDIFHPWEPWTVRITYLARELVKAGHEIKLLYHLRHPQDRDRTLPETSAYPFEVIPFLPQIYRYNPAFIRRCLALTKLVKWADLVHFQKCLYHVSVPAVISARLQAKPVHYDWDDSEDKIFEKVIVNKLNHWLLYHQMERQMPKLVDTISVASHGLQKLSARWGLPQDRVFYVPVGADLDLFNPARDGMAVRKRHGWAGPLVLYQGQLNASNYVHLFIKSAKIISAARNGITFAVVGGGDQVDQAKALVREEGLSRQITFTGPVSHAEVAEYVAAADVVVASFEDTPQAQCKSPLKVVEYLAAGKAIVASRVGEVVWMVGDGGCLVQADAPADMAAAVLNLLDHPERRQELGKLARERAERIYNWTQSAKALTAAYAKAMTLRRPRPN